MAHRVTGALLRIYLFCCGNYSVEKYKILRISFRFAKKKKGKQKVLSL